MSDKRLPYKSFLSQSTHSKVDLEKYIQMMIINFLRVISSTAEVKEANGIITKKTMESCIGRFLGPQY